MTNSNDWKASKFGSIYSFHPSFNFLANLEFTGHARFGLYFDRAICVCNNCKLCLHNFNNNIKYNQLYTFSTEFSTFQILLYYAVILLFTIFYKALQSHISRFFNLNFNLHNLSFLISIPKSKNVSAFCRNL